MSKKAALLIIGALIALRAVMAAVLPLSADEAYYWLWSKHLAAGYYDHPPAIAFLIRAGTLVFGDTMLGVRASGILSSLATSWFVWQSAAILLKDDAKGAWAAVFFNVTLMMGVELLAATPDQPSIATVAAYIWCLAKLQQTGNGRWWLAAGLAAGLSLLSKYSMLFVGLGTLVWMVPDARARAWLRTPWPYLGGLLALAVFSPNLAWQAQHHWETFAFQFSRIGHGGLTLRYLGEFIGAQLALATPLILVLAAFGLWRASRGDDARLLPASLVWTALAYFFFHALRDRVQGNWPCFLYPALAIFAADACANAPRWLSRAAAPLAGLMLLAAYAQGAFGVLVFKNDPASRLLGRGFAQVAQVVAKAADAGLAGAVVTTDYETTAWLRWYQPGLKVIEIDAPWRYADSPEPGQTLLDGRLVYLVEARREAAGTVQQYFQDVSLPNQITPPGGAPYELFLLKRPRRLSFGKMP